MAKKVIVLGEVRHNEIRNVSFEAIAAAKIISEGGEVAAALFNDTIDDLVYELIYYGADRVVKVEHPSLKEYTTDAFQQALLQIIEVEKPDVLIMGHTALGKDLSPRIAAKLQAGLVSDIVKLELTSSEIVYTRPIYSGKAFEKKTVNGGLTIATIRPNNIGTLQKDKSRTGKVGKQSVEINHVRTTIKEIVKKVAGGVDLSEAKIIVFSIPS